MYALIYSPPWAKSDDRLIHITLFANQSMRRKFWIQIASDYIKGVYPCRCEPLVNRNSYWNLYKFKWIGLLLRLVGFCSDVATLFDWADSTEWIAVSLTWYNIYIFNIMQYFFKNICNCVFQTYTMISCYKNV